MPPTTEPLPVQDAVFLLVGFGSEYSLGPLERFLARQGLDFVACDLQQRPLPELGDRPVILVTSQHPSTTTAIFRAHWGGSPPFSNYVAPDELLSRIRPVCSVFIPHDLEAPIRPDEIAYMGMFDLYCSPYPTNPAMQRLCRSLHAGWIKHNSLDVVSDDTRKLVADRGVFFVNQIVAVLRAGGVDHLCERYRAIFRGHVPVKLPQWPGAESMASELRARGVAVIDASEASTPIIAACPRIFVNAPGSVVSEARYVGTPVVMLDDFAQETPSVSSRDARPDVPHFDFTLLLSSLPPLCRKVRS